MRSLRLVSVVLASVVAAALVLAGASLAVGDERPVNISNRADVDWFPAVSGDRVAWRGGGPGGDDIFTWAAGDTTATDVSNQPGIEAGAGVSTQGSVDLVVWYGYGAPYDVYAWAPGVPAPINLSNNPGHQDYVGGVWGNRVAWTQYDGYDNEIYMWYFGDGKPPVRITNNGFGDSGPRVSGDRIVWTASPGGQGDIYTWAVGDLAPTIISDDPGNEYYPQISGNRVVWMRQAGGRYEIRTCTIGGLPVTIYSTQYANEVYPQISGGRIVWLGFANGNEAEVFSWTESTGPVNISSNGPVSDGHPQISGDIVVWPSGVDYGDIVAWAPGDAAPTNISKAPSISEGNPQISGNRVVWQGESYPEHNIEIYTVKLDEPTSTVLTGTSGTRTTTYNTATTIYADLKSGTTPVSGKSLLLEYSANGTSGWKRVATTITQPAAGRYQASVKRTSVGFYRFRFEGGLRYLPATGPVVRVYPKVRLTRSTSWTTLYLNKTYYSLGYVEPRHYSTSGKVVLRAYKRRSNGTYAALTSPTKTFGWGSTYTYYSSTKTKYRVPVKLPSRGYWKLVAYHAGDSANAGTYGSPDYVVVK